MVLVLPSFDIFSSLVKDVVSPTLGLAVKVSGDEEAAAWNLDSVKGQHLVTGAVVVDDMEDAVCDGNVALNGTCNQSTVLNNEAIYVCTGVIDGSKDGVTNCAHTGANDPNPRLSVFLKHSYFIHKLVFYARTGWTTRLQHILVYFDGACVHNVTYNATIVYWNISETSRLQAKNITLRREVFYDDDYYKLVNFCELEIYTCKRKLWGPRCDKPCDVNCAECKDSASKCLECEEGYWGANTCPNNCGQGCESGLCNVTDGTCQCRKQGQHWVSPKCERCSKDYWGANCTHECSKTCTGTDQEGYCDNTTGQCLKGCSAGYWGDNCSTTCGQGCGNTCNAKDGTCDCQVGWKPPRCEGCSKDYWGANCTHECSKTCTGTDQEGYCDNTTGQCLKGCSAGYWGDNCSTTCGQGCGNTCNAKDGTCYCQVGWKPPRCEVPSCTCGGAGCEGDNKYVFSELSRKINVAVGKNSIASTTLKAPKPVSGPACLANNGKTESTMVAIPSSAPECMSTAEGDLKPFWQVDLGEQYVVAGILIEWDNQMKSLFGIRVLLDGKQLYYSEKPMTNPTEVAANDLGQVVKLQREKFQDNKEWDDPLLRICEVEVYTCRPGYYGSDCQGICERPVCENLQICSPLDGSCPQDAPVAELDCSKLIIVAGCFVHVLVVALCILAAKVLPRKKRSGTKPGKHQTDKDQTKSDDENKEDKGDDKGEQSSQGGEEEKEGASSVEEAESQM
ncbi:uncharacterized protein LOC112553602 [Pomacea canaliculata]|uniref:uncharacterized protein LOC112553602 n=1 Tax=Pomacea canaliculata TaxID=400727 RepID=UPI000D731B10|nr:uncharacterized protein LOC112553602 [Pomacea canaliculata]